MEFNVIKNLFDCIKENDNVRLNSQILLKYGINNDSISTLLNRNILQRRIKGDYVINLGYLYLYIKKLRYTEYADKALEFFIYMEELLQLSNESKKYLIGFNCNHLFYQIFKLYIFKDDFVNAYEYFKKIVKRNDFFNQSSYILLNYILGNNIDNVSNIFLFKESLEKTCEINIMCVSHNFQSALNELAQFKFERNVEELGLSEAKINVLKILLNKCIEKQNKLIGNIFDFYANTGVNFEIACLQYGLDAYQINILKLLIAKHYYSFNDFENGDLYYYSVIESNYQNGITKSLIVEIEEKENLSNSIITSKLVDKLSRKKNS